MATYRKEPSSDSPRSQRSTSTGRGQPTRRAHEDEEDDGRHHAPFGEDLTGESNDRAAKIGWIVAGAFILIGGGIGLMVMNKHSKDRTAAQAYSQQLKDVKDALAKVDINNIDSMKAGLVYIEQQKSVWKGSPIGSEVVNAEATFKSKITQLEKFQDFLRRLSEAEGSVKSADSATADGLISLRRNVNELEREAQDVGTDATARCGVMSKQLDAKLADRLYADAIAAKGQGKTGLGAFARFEDEFAGLVKRSQTRKDMEFIKSLGDLRQKAIVESDNVAYAAFTPDFVKGVAGVSLLNDAKNFLASAGAEFRIDGGKMTIIGPTEGKSAIVSTKDQWRDFAVDIEFTLEKGKATMFFRVDDKADTKEVEAVSLGKGADVEVAYGQRVVATGTIIGSKFTFKLEGSDAVLERDVSPKKERRGGLGFVLSVGTSMQITKLQLRNLRG